MSQLRRRRRTTTSTMVYAQTWTEPKASGVKIIRKIRPYSMILSGTEFLALIAFIAFFAFIALIALFGFKG
jgi:hypothetical protein